MNANSIKRMSTEDKIRTMELLWDDLCQHATVQIPAWHEDVLTERSVAHDAGTEQPKAWQTAKQEDHVIVYAVLDCRSHPALVNKRFINVPK